MLAKDNNMTIDELTNSNNGLDKTQQFEASANSFDTL